MTGKEFRSQLANGIFTQNPIFVQMVGMCATLAVTTSAKNALGMGICTLIVLTMSNFLISLLRRWIPSAVRIAAYILMIAGLVTVLEMILQAYWPELGNSLGIFIPLIVVNCLILARAEAFASKNAVLPSVIDGLSMGLGFTLALFCLGLVREIFGTGSFFGHPLFFGNMKPVTILVLPAGAFLTLGFLTAFVQKLQSLYKARVAKTGKEKNR